MKFGRIVPQVALIDKSDFWLDLII